MKKRQTSEEERRLFETAVGGTRVSCKRTVLDSPVSLPVRRRRSRVAASPPKTSGVNGRTAERLRKGAIEPDARLDLHGLSEESAHRALTVFLRSAFSRGTRLALVVTGKGLKSSAPEVPFDLELGRRARGVLKTMVPRWLAEPDLLRFVADVRTAHRRHGGSGALYVYLRKEIRRA